MRSDGEIDYSQFDADELRQAEANINKSQYPKNYANLLAEIEARLEQQPEVAVKEAAERPSNPLEISGKTAETVIAEYDSTLNRAVVVTSIVLLMWSPSMLDWFVDFEHYLGLDRIARLKLQTLATGVYGWFVWKYWKCPNCGKFPGGGWRPKECKSCGVSLRAEAD